MVRQKRQQWATCVLSIGAYMRHHTHTYRQLYYSTWTPNSCPVFPPPRTMINRLCNMHISVGTQSFFLWTILTARTCPDNHNTDTQKNVAFSDGAYIIHFLMCDVCECAMCFIGEEEWKSKNKYMCFVLIFIFRDWQLCTGCLSTSTQQLDTTYFIYFGVFLQYWCNIQVNATWEKLKVLQRD